MSGLQWVCQNGELDKLIELIAEGANVNQTLSMGRRPLHFAADFGHTEVIRKLIESGADVNAVDQNKISVLLAAIFEGHTSSVELLLEKGATKEGTFDGKSYIECADKDEIKNLLK